jgi:hypothetical protein
VVSLCGPNFKLDANSKHLEEPQSSAQCVTHAFSLSNSVGKTNDDVDAVGINADEKHLDPYVFVAKCFLDPRYTLMESA